LADKKVESTFFIFCVNSLPIIATQRATERQCSPVISFLRIELIVGHFYSEREKNERRVELEGISTGFLGLIGK